MVFRDVEGHVKLRLGRRYQGPLYKWWPHPISPDKEEACRAGRTIEGSLLGLSTQARLHRATEGTERGDRKLEEAKL